MARLGFRESEGSSWLTSGRSFEELTESGNDGQELQCAH